MNIQTWTYLDDRGGRHEVNLYHSPRDGKLLVQVDGQPVVASVEARAGGRWTFLIEDELCDVVLARRGLEFLYGFEVNRRADTPRNRAIKNQDRRDFWLPMSIFLGALAVCSVLVFGRNFFFKKSEKPAGDAVETGGDEQVARLHYFGRKAVATLSNGSRADYSFKTEGGKTFGGSFLLKKNAAGQLVLPNGLPLEDGDEFEVEFLPETPAVNRLDLDRPTENQLARYEKRAAAVHQILHPDEPQGRAICLAQLARRRTGLRGLNDIFYQNYSPQQNTEHNRETFGRLVRDEVFKKMLLENCLE